jgi:hypothetical protein
MEEGWKGGRQEWKKAGMEEGWNGGVLEEAEMLLDLVGCIGSSERTHVEYFPCLVQVELFLDWRLSIPSPSRTHHLNEEIEFLLIEHSMTRILLGEWKRLRRRRRKKKKKMQKRGMKTKRKKREMRMRRKRSRMEMSKRKKKRKRMERSKRKEKRNKKQRERLKREKMKKERMTSDVGRREEGGEVGCPSQTYCPQKEERISVVFCQELVFLEWPVFFLTELKRS